MNVYAATFRGKVHFIEADSFVKALAAWIDFKKQEGCTSLGAEPERLEKVGENGVVRYLPDRSALAPRQALRTLFSVRTSNAIQRIGIGSLEELAKKSAVDLKLVKGLGPTSLREIRHVLSNHNLALMGES